MQMSSIRLRDAINPFFAFEADRDLLLNLFFVFVASHKLPLSPCFRFNSPLRYARQCQR